MKKTWLASCCLIAVVIVSSCGSNENKPASGGGESKPGKETGEAIYSRTCVACHLAKGEGVPNTYPPLSKSDYLANKENAIHQVLKGSSGELVVNGNKFNNTMPPQQLSDDEVAAVLTYVYGNFGNSGGTVTPDEVKQARGKM